MNHDPTKPDATMRALGPTGGDFSVYVGPKKAATECAVQSCDMRPFWRIWYRVRTDTGKVIDVKSPLRLCIHCEQTYDAPELVEAAPEKTIEFINEVLAVRGLGKLVISPSETITIEDP